MVGSLDFLEVIGVGENCIVLVPLLVCAHLAVVPAYLLLPHCSVCVEVLECVVLELDEAADEADDQVTDSEGHCDSPFYAGWRYGVEDTGTDHDDEDLHASDAEEDNDEENGLCDAIENGAFVTSNSGVDEVENVHENECVEDP